MVLCVVMCSLFGENLQLHKQVIRDMIPGLENALLGQPIIRKLNLLSSVCTVESRSARIVADRPKLFESLGKMEEESTILRRTVILLCQHQEEWLFR